MFDDPVKVDIDQIIKSLNGPAMDDELKEMLGRGLRNVFLKPPVEQTSWVLQRQCTLEQVQSLLFVPTPRDMTLYPLLITSAPAHDMQHPQTKTQIPFLSVLYLFHSFSWDHVLPFVLAGGLRVLVNIFSHPNDMIQGQAFETFLHISSEQVYDWFNAKSEPVPASPQDHLALTKMRDLSSTDILEVLVKKSGTRVSWPALQILAFWMSFMRARFTPDGILYVGPEIVSAFKNWVPGPESDEEPELHLAKQLFEDFSRFERKDEREEQRKKEKEEFERKKAEKEKKELEERLKNVDEYPYLKMTEEKRKEEEERKRMASEEGKTIEETPQPALPPLDTMNQTPQALKAEGNKFFQRGEYQQAMSLYSAALEQCSVHPFILNSEIPTPTFDGEKNGEEQNKSDDHEGNNEEKKAEGDETSQTEIEVPKQAPLPLLRNIMPSLAPASLATYSTIRLNRAAAALKLQGCISGMRKEGQLQISHLLHSVIHDCSVVLEIEGDNAKAYYRRASALQLLHHTDAALVDAEKAESLSPSTETRALVRMLKQDLYRDTHEADVPTATLHSVTREPVDQPQPHPSSTQMQEERQKQEEHDEEEVRRRGQEEEEPEKLPPVSYGNGRVLIEELPDPK
ncbi:hypothetical protein BLNAU_8528 [Blattamonas nauphoetae]|uniref:Uncharacterized protein n=1 Tax=Blattamonas nauphoetae TaxID=2049346 RepID=A0ABQ9XYC8_9EUKA|nr:hypothetical protein BLNAU_8528 [Blattamonas nauphoetae]